MRRDQAQLKLRATSQAIVDADIANLRSARAQVAQQEAVIAQKTLRAPFAGRLGIRSVDLGQYISAGATIVTLQALDPIYLDFVLPQQAFDGIKVGQTIQASVDAFPGRTFSGTIAAINSKVDQSSRNVQVRASLTNSDNKLLPGMFASIEISIGKIERFVTLPQTAIVYAPYGNSVFLAEKNDKEAGSGAPAAALVARQTFVQTRRNSRRSGRGSERPVGGRVSRHRRSNQTEEWRAAEGRQYGSADRTTPILSPVDR